MAFSKYTAEILRSLADQLGDQSRLLAREADRLEKLGPTASVEVKYSFTRGSPVVRGMAAITQFVGAIVAAGGHETIARLADLNHAENSAGPSGRRRKPKP